MLYEYSGISKALDRAFIAGFAFGSVTTGLFSIVAVILFR